MFLDLLEVEENLSVRKRLLQWIAQCGPAVIPQAVQRLTNPKWYVVRNMLVLLKDLGAKEALPEIVRCLQQDSSKLRLAALQAIESLGKGTDSYYRALSTALRDSDPVVFRKAVSMTLSPPDPRALEMITARLRYSGEIKTDGQLITVLEMIRKSRVKELLPALVKLRRQLSLRFWQWNRTRVLYKAVKHTVRELQSGKRNYA
jgi:HEAT repeat protein